ncbi:MAG TPA: glycoside hydrolase family 15 protein [Rhodocyclaceae bacterium]|nr:glycoside hydrolase family 15 protein [Rhodocyclaceae bacterium]
MKDIDAIAALLESCDYEPIGDYAAIGDCRSAALVSRTGSIDWLCLPDFSSPSIFAALLDRRRGGRFLIRPRDVTRVERRYVGRSAVLETTFHCASGMVRLTDLMPMPEGDEAVRYVDRLVDCLEGQAVVDVAYQPQPDYGRQAVHLDSRDGGVWLCGLAGASLLLHTEVPLADGAGWAGGSCALAAGEQRRFVLAFAPQVAAVRADPPMAAVAKARTVNWWEAWCSRCSYDGPHPDLVMRSCLTLKLLTCCSSGAVIAAATTSLPESMTAERNWDYRYCWLRDTSLLLQSFIDMGFEDESAAFLGWLLKIGRKPRIQPLYDLNGCPVPDEEVLAHLEGYRGRGPVRIGNSAHQQLQLDIYGELIQTAYRFAVRGGTLTEAERRLLAGLGDSVCRLWRQPDQSIWETRSPPRHYTYSKLMCWVALDRLLALNQLVPMPIQEDDLRLERDLIRREIDARGFDHTIGGYVGYFGGSDPDASLLLMVRYGYVRADDPRMAGTYRYIMERLAVDGFLLRYPPGEDYDGVKGAENLFAVCSFWVVDYLARSGRVDEALQLFERLLGLANDVGLYSEQFDTASRLALGNFPQAFTHSGLVTAALAIEQALKGKRGHQIAT